MTLEEIKAKKQYWRDTRVSGVYFLFDREELIYIGSSIDCPNRIREHRKDKEFDSYYIIKTLPEDRLEIEADYIQKFKPPLNKKIPIKVSLEEIKVFKRELSYSINTNIKSFEPEKVNDYLEYIAIKLDRERRGFFSNRSPHLN